VREWSGNLKRELATLTERQQQIVKLLCEGHSNKTIARNLKLSEGTVKSHLHNIYIKLGVESRSALKIGWANRSPAD
jgi:DNA-binding NarL/FixJ family response regulator